MIKKLILLLFFIGFSTQAQHTVKGTFLNSTNETWVILYRVQAGEQHFIANTNVTDGKFTLNIKKGATTGIYRLVYKLNSSNYLDFIYNNEDIELAFDPKNPSGSISFIKSAENKLYKKYMARIYEPQSQIDSLQLLYFRDVDDAQRSKIRTAYTANLKKLSAVQSQFENSSKGMLNYHFIKASKRYNAAIPFKDPAQYLVAIKSHFFDAINFNNKALLKSILVLDRIEDYIFRVNIYSDTDTKEKLYKNSVNEVFSKITNKDLRKKLTYYLIKKFSDQENATLTVYLFDNYFDLLPKADQDISYKKTILSKLKIALNAKAPNITWTEAGVKKSLYGLSNARYYMVLFWSSTCGHCLREVPEIYNLLKDKDIQVVAVGLENPTSPWKDMIKKYPKFIHVFGKGKWRNTFAKAYDIHATPTYIILDADKNIVAKPYALDDVKKVVVDLKM